MISTPHSRNLPPALDAPRAISRRGFLAAALAVGTLSTLSSCAHLTSPRPDRGAEVLRALAARDKELFADSNAELEALRSAQNRVLEAEITRACGSRKDGKPVDECGSSVQLASNLPPAATAADILTDSRSNTALLQVLDEGALRENYAARLATAVDGGLVLALRSVGAQWQELLPTVPNAQEFGKNSVTGAEEQLATALRAEHMMVYGSGVVAARVSGERTTAVMARAERHRVLRDRCWELLTAADLEAPEPAAGYTSTGVPSPTDAPIEYLDALERYCAQAWEDVFKSARKAPLRLFALHAAGVSAAGAAALNGAEMEPLPGLAQ